MAAPTLDELRARAVVLASGDDDDAAQARFYLDQGAIPVKPQVGDIIFAPGGGPLYPGYTFYSGGSVSAFVPTYGPGNVVPVNSVFIAQPKTSDGGFFQQTLSPQGIAQSTREVHGGAAVILAPFAVLGALAGVAAAGAAGAGAGATTADSALVASDTLTFTGNVAGGDAVAVGTGDAVATGTAATTTASTAAPTFTGADAALGNEVVAAPQFTGADAALGNTVAATSTTATTGGASSAGELGAQLLKSAGSTAVSKIANALGGSILGKKTTAQAAPPPAPMPAAATGGAGVLLALLGAGALALVLN